MRIGVAMVVTCALGSMCWWANASAASGGPCGTLALPSTHYSGVVWIWMENHNYGEIIGSPEAPYVNTLAGECGLATNYHNISHPSLPNYIAATSGLSFKQLRHFKGDCEPSKRCSTPAPSIFGQLSSWKAYEESMPSPCSSEGSGEYDVNHNPPPYYTSLVECASKDVSYSQLSTDLTSHALPVFSFITPNLVNDMHDGTIADGDAWLQANLPPILESSEYTEGRLVVFVTWDEGEGGRSNKCATNTKDIGCRVATIVLSPSTVPGTQPAMLFNHYSLLASTEQLLGLPLLGEASSASSMLAAFNL
jgi:hypothetical protein